jgi:orotate phosphoribosyltransferase
MTDRARLIELVKQNALEFGDFTLTSGKKATYYLDGKQVTLDADGAHLVGAAVLDAIADDRPDAVGGMSIGADPIVGAVLAEAGRRGIALKGFLVRKEAKKHGKQRWVEGPLRPGSRVVILEDVVTTGGSALAAIERVEELDCPVVRVVCLVDRLEGGREAFQARGYAFTPLLTIADLGLDPPNSP